MGCVLAHASEWTHSANAIHGASASLMSTARRSRASVYRDGEVVAEPNGERERVAVARWDAQSADAIVTGHRPSYGASAMHT